MFHRAQAIEKLQVQGPNVEKIFQNEEHLKKKLKLSEI